MTPPVVLDSQTSASYMLQQASCAAHVLVNRTGIPKDAWEDLRQEFVLDCLQRAPGFDPSRGEWRAFVRRLMRNRSGVAAHRDPLMFHRELLYLSRDRFDILRSELWELTQAFLDARRRGVFYQNTSFCFNYHRPCAYFALCRSNGNPNVIDNFYQRSAPNEELRVLPETTPEPVF